MTEPLIQLPAANASSLLKATAIALITALLILITIVLPAEYGGDPTGIGKWLGLTELYSAKSESVGNEVAPLQALPATAATVPESPRAGTADAPPVSTQISSDPNQSFDLQAVHQQPAAFRTDELRLTLEPGRGAEIKAKMRAKESFVFSWSATGPVNFDMHGDQPDNSGRFTSYWLGQGAVQGHGSFIAPFDGAHGWYWKNKSTAPVTITVKASGHFEALYKP